MWIYLGDLYKSVIPCKLLGLQFDYSLIQKSRESLQYRVSQEKTMTFSIGIIQVSSGSKCEISPETTISGIVMLAHW